MTPSRHQAMQAKVARLMELADAAGDFDLWAEELKRPYDWQEDGL